MEQSTTTARQTPPTTPRADELDEVIHRHAQLLGGFEVAAEHYIWTDPADGSTTECREVSLPHGICGDGGGLTPEQAAAIGGAMMVAAFLLDPELLQRSRLTMPHETTPTEVSR